VRPIELTLDGFRSFHGSETLRWDDRRLVGVVGPIGSGKSSILDGIAFALYGRTPRIAREIRSLVNQRRDQGSVSLLFEVDGERWRVVRSLRRSGQSAHVLFEVGDGGETEVADRRDEVNKRIAELLGLDFEAFRRSILLAQGEFDRFLRGTAAERDDVLKGVFGLDRIDAMRERAKTERDLASGELQALDALRENLETDRRLLAEAKKALPAAQDRSRQLQKLGGAVVELGERRAAAAAGAEAAVVRLATLATLGERFPSEKVTGELLETLRTIARDRAAAEAALAAALERSGGKPALDRAGALVATYEARTVAVGDARTGAERAAATRTEAESDHAALQARAESAAEEAAAAEKAVSAARAAHGQAEGELHEARHGAMAATLRAGLERGSPCPVCRQPVVELPPESPSTELERAEEAVAEAVSRVRSAEAAAKRAASEAAEAAKSAAASGEVAAGRGERAVEAQQALDAALEALESAAAAVAAVLGDGEPRRRLEQLRREVGGAEKEIARLAERAEAIEGQRDLLVTSLAALAGALGREAPTGREPEVLEKAIQGLRAEWGRQRDEAELQRSTAEAEVKAVDERYAALLVEAGLDPDDDPAAATEEAVVAAAAIEARVGDLEARLDRLGKLEAEHAAIVARRDRFQQLVADLARTKFPAYVLTERRRALADLGGVLFETLSGSRYRFSDDGDFDVVDLAAAERRRSADSLSGGETFLASLALALALAETVAREGGRLDAFFLDEGFGSLDPEHLDLAMEGIEKMTTMAERLVVVVSHVSGLRDRLEDLIVLDKDPVTGDTVVVEGAGG
jgi:exonuclease SbcC